MRRLKQLEDENNKLRKVVADLSLDKEINAAGSRWRSQPGIVSKAEKSNRSGPKIGLTALA